MDEVNQNRTHVISQFNFGARNESETNLIFTCSTRPGRIFKLRPWSESAHHRSGHSWTVPACCRGPLRGEIGGLLNRHDVRRMCSCSAHPLGSLGVLSRRVHSRLSCSVPGRLLRACHLSISSRHGVRPRGE